MKEKIKGESKGFLKDTGNIVVERLELLGRGGVCLWGLLRGEPHDLFIRRKQKMWIQERLHFFFFPTIFFIFFLYLVCC